MANQVKLAAIKPPSSPAHHIAQQFQAVHPVSQESGEKAQRDMYEVERAQDFMQKNPYGITYGKP